MSKLSHLFILFVLIGFQSTAIATTQNIDNTHSLTEARVKQLVKKADDFRLGES